MNIADKLRKVLEIKNNIKAALEEKGIENVSNDFSTFAENIANIKGGGDEPEIPEIPEIEIPELPGLPGLPDLRAILDENVIEGYPYRIAQLVVDSEPTSTLSNDYNNPSPCKIRTSDGRTYTSYNGSGWNNTSHTWTYGTTGYRWIIHYYDTQTISFTNIQNNCLQIILDGVRMYDYGSLLPAPGVSVTVSKKALDDREEYIRSIESINGGKWLSVNSNKKASYKEIFKDCYSLEYLSDDIFDLDHMGSCTSSDDYNSMFFGCYFLKSIPNLNISYAAASLSNLFQDCYSLTTIPELNTSNVANFSSMFNNCHSLTTIPELNTSKGTNFGSMFYGCYSLTTIPELNTSKGTSFSDMFNSCFSLATIPELDTSNGIYFSSMFNSCYSLTTIPELDTSNGTSFSSMFYGCYSLTTIPELNTSNGTSFSSMFNNCYSLVTIPLIDTSNGTSFSSMFNNCHSLVTIPLIDTSNGTSFEKMFYYCRSLKFIPELNTSNGTNFNNYIEYLWGSPIKEVKVNVSNSTRAVTLFNSYCNNVKSVIITIGNNFNYSLSIRNLYGNYLKIIGNIQNSLSVGTYLSIFEIDGTINYNLDFSNAKRLTKQSLLNILNALVPQEEGVTKTLTLGSDNLAKLSEEEIAIATSKGWTIS